MRRSILFFVGLSMVATGCVKKSEYEAVSAKLKDAQAQLVASQQKLQDLQTALDQELANVAQLKQQIAAAETQLADVNAQLAAANDQNTSLSEQLAATIKDKAKLKASAEELTRAIAELQKRKAEAEARVKEFKDLIAKFQKLIDAGKLKVKIKNGRMVLVLPTDILFASGKAELSDEGILAIQEVAQVLATIKDREFQVEGHTDNVPLANHKRFKNNWDLASKRAMVVVDAMIEAGMSGEVLSAASYGEYRPVATNDTPEGRAANRRIDIVIVPDLSKLPGFAELQRVVGSK